jgi:hypothetical protein
MKTFKGWRRLRRNEKPRVGDRVTFAPARHISPFTMAEVTYNGSVPFGGDGCVYRRVACTYAKKYKAKRPPTCCCDVCRRKYEQASRRAAAKSS